MFDSMLNNIYKEYDMNIISEDKLNNTLDLSVKGILMDFCAGKKCALWGAGRMNTTSSHAAVLLGKYATYLQNMVCVIDSDPSLQGKTFLGYPIVAPQDILQYDIDVVIISSKNSGKSIVESLQAVSPNQNYVDIYEQLREKGIEVYNSFFDEHSIYTEIFGLQQKLKAAESEMECAGILEKLISLYLSIKDFYYAFEYMDLYVEKQYEKWENYRQVKDKILEVLQHMKEKIANRKDDVSLFYVDALRGKDSYEADGTLKLFERYKPHAQVYTNVYSMGATTYESMVSAILGKYPRECDVYTDNFLRDFEEFAFLQKACDEQYQIHFLVSDCYRLLENTEKAHFDIQIYMSQKLWSLANILASSEEKTFNFLYFPYEIHCPMLCGMHEVKPVIVSFSDMGIEKFPESLEKQYEECVDYMDKQFDFYYDLLAPKSTKLIFSDHSQVVYDKENQNRSYNMYYKNKELTTHIPFLVVREGLEPTTFDGMLSMHEWNDFIIHAMDGKVFDDLERDIIRYQYYPIHSQKIRNHCHRYGFEDYIDGIDVFLNKEMIYVVTGTGKQEVYRHCDLEHDLIEEECGKAFIASVKEHFPM